MSHCTRISIVSAWSHLLSQGTILSYQGRGLYRCFFREGNVKPLVLADRMLDYLQTRDKKAYQKEVAFQKVTNLMLAGAFSVSYRGHHNLFLLIL